MKHETNAGKRPEPIGRRDLIAIFGGAALAWLVPARAQPAGERPVIGYLSPGRPEEFAPYTSAFMDGMRDLGYVEGQSVDIDYRFADDNSQQLTSQAEELASLTPDVIVAADVPSAAAVKKATSSIPIVAAMLVDPVNQGLVASYARPGGNLTGILISVQGLIGKRLEVLRELVPSATTIGLLVNPANPTIAITRTEIEAAGRATGVKIVVAEAVAASQIDSALKALIAAGVQAVFVSGDPMIFDESKRIAGLALAAHLPTFAATRLYVEAGCLISYGVSYLGNARRAAYFVDKILKGTKPADLPVEFPTKMEMAVNMKTAKALGIILPPSILLRAELIE